MKWPFVRRSKHEQIWNDFKIVQYERNNFLKHNNQLSDENDSLCQEIVKKDDIIANQMDSIKEQFNEINRLNQELASELNSHRETRETKNKVIESNINQIRGLEKDFEREFNLHKETKEQKNELSAECDRLYDEVDNIKKELKKTKDLWHRSLNHNDSFLKEIRRLDKELEETKDALKIAQEDLKETKGHEQKLFEARDKLNQQNIGLLYELEEWKSCANFWMDKSKTAKESISKVRGTLRQIAKKL